MNSIKNKLILLFSLLTFLTYGQNAITARAGKGIQFKTDDDSFYLKFRTRIQTRWDFHQYLQDDPTLKQQFETQAFVKRARLKFDGYFLNKNLRYKIEYDVVGGYVRDAVIKYKMGDFDLWFGQAKLPGNRERIVSSANMQFVDRSVYNYNFNPDRDFGFQLHHKFNIGNAVVKDIYAISAGNGIRNNYPSNGLDFTAKLEILPFGEFTNKGDYVGADIFREETPKLAIAFWGDYNMKANKDKGQLGSVLATSDNSDIVNLGFDMLFKYSGFSFMAEGGKRGVAKGDYFIYDLAGQAIDAYYQGYGLNLQGGYVFENNYELSARYSFADPEDLITQNISKIDFQKFTDYTIGLSKYIIGHDFKIQADFTLRQREIASDLLIFRLQMDFQL